MFDINAMGKRYLSRGWPFPQHKLNKLLEWQRIRELIVDLQIDCVLDVGAARGQFASNLRQIGFAGPIISFEPVPEAYAEMEKALATDKLWAGRNIALGQIDGDLEFYVAEDSTEMSSVLPPNDDSWALRVVRIPVRRLDSIFTEVTAPFAAHKIMLKMDTQGYDVHVFKGSIDTLPRICALQSELSVIPQYQGAPLYLEALELYREFGFHVAGMYEAAREQHTGIVTEFNCLLVKKELK